MRAHETRSEQTGARPAAARPASTPGTPVQRMMTLQRLAGNAAVARAVEAERHTHGPGCGHAEPGAGQAVQREESATGSAARPGPSSVEEAIASPGKPLDSRIRARAEQSYGMSFGHVRVHSGPVAQRSALEFGARAYTTGAHIVSGSDTLDDATVFHEVDHVYQQAMGPVAGSDNGAGAKVSRPDDAFEQSAEHNGRRMAQGLAPDLDLPGT